MAVLVHSWIEGLVSFLVDESSVDWLLEHRHISLCFFHWSDMLKIHPSCFLCPFLVLCVGFVERVIDFVSLDFVNDVIFEFLNVGFQPEVGVDEPISELDFVADFLALLLDLQFL